MESEFKSHDCLNRVFFGTYKLKAEICQISLEMISDVLTKMGIRPRFDTAQLYFNEDIVGRVAESLTDCEITTKLKKYSSNKRAREAIANSFTVLKNIDTFLLHNPMNMGHWRMLEELWLKKQVKSIGVSNHGLTDLENLFEKCTVKPTINQIEVHPFVNVGELMRLIEFCKTNGIAVVGHTILAQGKFFNNPVLMAVAKAHSKTVAQVMIKWALEKDIDICLRTTSRNHLNEIIEACNNSWSLSTMETQAIDEIHHETEYNFYIKQNKKIELTEIPYIASTLLKDIQAMKNQQSISDVCMTVPKSNRAQTEIIDALTNILFPDEPKPESKSKIPESKPKSESKSEPKSKPKVYSQSLESKRSRYDNQMKLLRKYYESQLIKSQKEKWHGKSCCLLTNKPSDRVTQPTPMPVDIAETTKIDPFINWLGTNEPIQAPQMFTLGTMFPDGRMDMCKQVVGPTHIRKLCQAVAKNDQVQHFLLGNNIACDGNYTLGAEAMAELMKSSADIKTWYLAGNCIDADCIKILCQGLKTNTTCEALWLKRNPVMARGAGYLGNLFNYNHTLQLLDLHNCGLLNAGLIAFCEAIQCRPEDFSLKHIYLDANGITGISTEEAPATEAETKAETEAEASAEATKTMEVFGKFLNYYKNQLESLFISINKLGDAGTMKICENLAGSQSLKRLVLSSNGITDLAVESIVNCALGCPNLQVLDLGYYKSTADMGECQNKITDVSLGHFERLLREHPNLCLLDLIKNKISVAGLKTLTKIDSQASLNMSELTPEGEKPIYVVRHDKGVLREIKHTALVYNIDSVYRNNM